MFSFIRRHKIISGLVCANLITIIAVAVVIIIHQHQTATIDINVTPSAATITLNGRQYDNFQSYDILPGDYHVKIDMGGMQAKEYDLTLEKDGFARIWDYLLDANGGFDYYLSHPDDELILTQVAGEDDKAAQAFIAEYQAKTKIFDDLPIIDETPSEYGDMYGVEHMYNTLILEDGRESEECNAALCIFATGTPDSIEDRAPVIIRDLGYNPADYQVIYKVREYEQD